MSKPATYLNQFETVFSEFTGANATLITNQDATASKFEKLVATTVCVTVLEPENTKEVVTHLRDFGEKYGGGRNFGFSKDAAKKLADLAKLVTSLEALPTLGNSITKHVVVDILTKAIDTLGVNGVFELKRVDWSRFITSLQKLGNPLSKEYHEWLASTKIKIANTKNKKAKEELQNLLTCKCEDGTEVEFVELYVDADVIELDNKPADKKAGTEARTFGKINKPHMLKVWEKDREEEAKAAKSKVASSNIDRNIAGMAKVATKTAKLQAYKNAEEFKQHILIEFQELLDAQLPDLLKAEEDKAKAKEQEQSKKEKLEILKLELKLAEKQGKKSEVEKLEKQIEELNKN